MYNLTLEDIIFLMFYASVAILSLMASCYLLFRRANAIAPDVMSPLRLRRWTAAFFAVFAFCHLWYLPTYFLTSPDDMMLGSLIAGLLDCMMVIPLTIVVLLVMLQDRRRPLWPVAVMVAPLVVGNAFCVATRSDVLLPVDLEQKEVWQGFVVLAIFFLVYAIYSLDAGELIYEFALEVINIVLICYLLWRVETLSDLSISQSLAVNEGTVTTEEQAPSDDLGPYLQKYCIDTQLYLQHDLTITQLAQALGTNRFYLSKYFSRQGITYNAYINDLRIHHFISLYREAVADLRPFTAQQLAHDSGYRSYSTFSLAFKQRMGLSVTVWMRDSAE